MKLLLTLFVTVIFFRISKINKIGPMVAGNELGVKVFHTGSHLAKNVRKNILR